MAVLLFFSTFTIPGNSFQSCDFYFFVILAFSVS